MSSASSKEQPIAATSPTAFMAVPSSGSAPLSVQLDGSGSSDADGTVVLYEWDLEYDGEVFGADITSSTPTASHVYDFGGREGDVPVAGDFNGDGVTEVGVRRNRNFQRLLKSIPDLLKKLRDGLNNISFDQHCAAQLFKDQEIKLTQATEEKGGECDA